MPGQNKKRDWKWWLETLGEGVLTAGITFAPELAPALIQEVASDHTLVFRFAPLIGAFLKYVRTKYQVSKKPDNVPQGVKNSMERMRRLEETTINKLPKGKRRK